MTGAGGRDRRCQDCFGQQQQQSGKGADAQGQATPGTGTGDLDWGLSSTERSHNSAKQHNSRGGRPLATCFSVGQSRARAH